MLQYVLTAIAGVAIGVVGMRIWQARGASGAEIPHGDASEARVEPSKPAKLPFSPPTLMLIAAGLVALLAIGIRQFGGGFDEPSGSASISTAPQGASTPGLDDVDTMITRLAKRLEQEPDNGEGHRMLGWSYVMTGRPNEAIAPYKRALELLPNNAAVHSGYGEALVGISGNSVTAEAKRHFEQALAIDPTEPRARYFMGLWKSQNGQKAQALEDWITLANGAPPDAQWQAEVRSAIERVSAELGVDNSTRLKTPVASTSAESAMPVLDSQTVTAANRMSEGERSAMVAGMVDGLAKKLAANPQDADGWVRLIRSRMVLGDTAQAKADLATARKALAADKAGLAKLNGLAKELSL